MTTLRRRAATIFIAFLTTSAAGAAGQNSSQFREWKPSALPDATQVRARIPCSTLVSLTGYEFSVSSAAAVPASADMPERCRVAGQVLPEIRFEVSLPPVWNGRLYMFGNGGYAGEQLDAPGRIASVRRALAQGFAVAQTNTGHDAQVEPLGAFAASPQKMLDYAYRSVHVTALTAKKILEAYYAGPLKHSYFDGCSTGGRQGLISAQRFPEDFDGIVVGSPVLNFAGTMISYAVMQRALKAAPIAVDKVRIVREAVYAKCDAIDGVKDDLIDDPRKCPFKPSDDLPRCADDADGPACFTAAQIKTLETIYGSVTLGGAEFFPGWPIGAEGGWTPWFVAPPTSAPIQVAFGETFFKNLAFGRPIPGYDWLSFDLEKDLDKLQATRSLLDATDADLSRFKARGAKIVSYFGWADPALNPMMGVRYYESVTRKMGASTPDFYRLFMVPGMYHCQGGPGVSTFDALTPLVEWVEKGTAPQQIVGSRIVDGKPVRTRPLCPYPQVAKYKGSGNIDEAANFSCAGP